MEVYITHTCYSFLFSEATMPARRQWSSEDMKDAIQAVKSGMPKATAAKTYGVPRTTLLDRLQCKSDKRIGRETVLTMEEESKLASWMNAMAR